MGLRIPLGTDVFTGEEICFQEPPKSNYIMVIAGETQYGKSSVCKLVYTYIAKHSDRPILIFDYKGEHEGAKWVNWDSEHDHRSIGDLLVLRREEFGFFLSDFYNRGDWEALEFPEGSSRELSLLARERRAHNNEIAYFWEMLKDLPIQRDEVFEFARTYGVDLERTVFASTRDSILGRFDEVRRTKLFLSSEDATQWNGAKLERKDIQHIIENKHKLYIYNWATFLKKHPHLCVNLQVTDTRDVKAVVGKILEQLSPAIQSLRPLIVGEEADKWLPNYMLQPMKSYPSSLYWGREYATKFMKYGVALILITQSPDMIDPSIIGNLHTRIYGKLPDGRGYVPEETKKLQWDRNLDYRQFSLYSKDKSSGYKIFVPYTCPCSYKV